jgi:flotillin
MQVKVIERTQQIQLQEQEIVRRERELESKVRKPAEAEKYKMEKLAEADRSVNNHKVCSVEVKRYIIRLDTNMFIFPDAKLNITEEKCKT